MNTNSTQSTAKPASFSSIIIAWTVVLLVSDLPDAIWQALAGATPTWLFWVKVGILFVMILLGWVWKRPYSLHPFFILLLILAAGRKVLNSLGLTPSYVAQGEQAGVLLRMAQFEGSRLLLTAVMVTALLIMGKRRQDFFLAKGNLKKWKRPGIIIALFIMVLTFLFFDYDLPSAAILKALPLMPAALLFAALAAFDEEVRSRATLLPHLYDVVGKNHAIMITAFYFGMGHYFGGVPSGVEGFFIAGALGWLYATMMLETRGVFMPWLNHFLTNIPTFIFWAIGSISG
jgi:membrane protease YdiL (CAAX protease family)